MKDFENLKSKWENQPELKAPNNGSRLIIEKTERLKKKQQIANMVLGVTVIILIGFFFYIAAYNEPLVSGALLLMTSSLLVRMLIEFFSIKRLKEINQNLDYNVFKKRIVAYYKKRVNTHYVATPIIIALYAIGFTILLPFFKLELSSFFYSYILVSGIVILIIGVFLIWKQIQKELLILKELSN